MNDNDIRSESDGHSRRMRIGPLPSAVLILLSALLTSAAIGAAGVGLLLPCLLLSSASVGIMSVLFFASAPLPSLLSPLAAAALAVILGASPLLAAAVAAFVALTAGIMALLTRLGVDPFPLRVAVILICSLAAAAALAALLCSRYGSFGVGLDSVSEFLKSYLYAALTSVYGDSASFSLESAAESMSNSTIMLLPGMICCIGVVSSWLIFAVARAAASAVGRRRNFFPSAPVPPRPLAIIYLIVFVLSLFMSGTDAVSFAFMNIWLILTLLFFGEGVRIIVTLVKLKQLGGSAVLTALVGGALLLMVTPLVPPAAALIIIRSGKRGAPGGKKN